MAVDLEQGDYSAASSSTALFAPERGSDRPQKYTPDDENVYSNNTEQVQSRRHPSWVRAPSLKPDSEAGVSVTKQVAQEAENAIQYRTCSWQKTAALLFSEYICLAVMSFPQSYATLGLVPGLILTVLVACLVLYTSLIIWKYCLRHPDVRDISDIGQRLFWNSKIAWYITAAMFLLNNTFIQGLHCLVGAQYLNTMTNHAACTVAFAAITAIVSFFCSLPRTFNSLSKVASITTIFTLTSVILATTFAAIEDHPAGYNSDVNHMGPHGAKLGGEPIVLAFPIDGTTFLAATGAFLNICYTFIGQITLPSFIAEMRNPKEFDKALWAIAVFEVIVFGLVGSIVYAYTGNQYMTAPAFGSLSNEIYKKVSFSFMVPTLVFLGVLYASVSARFIFFRLFEGTYHKSHHTVLGWSTWCVLLATTWFFAFIIAEVIPFFSDLLSIMCSLFDSFFGFIFWGVAYLRMQAADEAANPNQRRGIRGQIGYVANIILIGIGLFFLGPGTYASICSVILNYKNGNVVGPFTCADNGL